MLKLKLARANNHGCKSYHAYALYSLATNFWLLRQVTDSANSDLFSGISTVYRSATHLC